ncbi:MAG: hypothetical protein ACR2GU_13380 [Rubrobacteraceae bacterium]
MSEFGRELSLDELPRPPLFALVDADDGWTFEETAIGDEVSKAGALFTTLEIAEEFSSAAEEHGMSAFAGLPPREISSWESVEAYATSGEDYVLVISAEGVGLFYAGDVARYASERALELPFPLYVMADERGDVPLISVETGAEEELIVALFSSPDKAHAFRERAAHLGLPETLGTIEDDDGLRRHALIAREAGAVYAVLDPESGPAEAMLLEDLIH